MRLPKALAVCVVVLLVAASAGAARAATDHSQGRRASSAGARLASIPGGWNTASGETHPVSSAAGSSTSASAGSAAAGVSGANITAPASVTVAGANDQGAPAAAAPQPVALPVPSTKSLPFVAPLRAVRSADAVVLLRSPLSAVEAHNISLLHNLVAVERVDTGTVQLAGAPVVTFGVDPGTFRSFTPPASADADRLWQYLAAGSLVSSYEMAGDRKLQLGAEEPIGSVQEPAAAQGWLGAFASIGLPGVDLLVDHTFSSALGLVPNTGLVVSAPATDGQQLVSELRAALPGGAVELLRPDQLSGVTNGNGLSLLQRSTLISAAKSRIGMPYVWGATGPTSFDCSGLVKWAFAQAGILMPRTADQQFLTGVRIPLASAQPGDLLFWTYDSNDPSFVDHTAIYLGNGLMVVAPHTGLDVEVTAVPTSDFASAVHVLLRPA